MMPALALTLSFDGISLLRQVPGGWALVGDVALDADDLRAALADLRTEADSLVDHGGQVKLVLPNEQIKYLSVPDQGQSDEALTATIRDALDGATPYAVDDLQFDWSRSDGQLHIAAVAKETLDEAEAFAKSHHFDPVCFVAKAPDGTFEGEVFFGPAASWTGEKPSKSDAAFTIVDAPSAPVEDAPEDALTVDEDAPVDPSFADLVEDTSAQLEADEVLADNVTRDADAEDALTPGAAATPDAGPVPDAEPDDAAAEATTPKITLTPPPTPPATPSFASIRASRSAPESTAPTIGSAGAPASDGVTPRIKLGGARKSTDDSEVTAADLLVDKPEATAERKNVGFFSRRQSKDPVVEPEKADTSTPPKPDAAKPAEKPHDPTPARAAVARIAAMRAGRDPDASDAASEAVAIPDERTRMTVFGARAEPQIGGKPRFLGLILTSALLIFLLAVAAWASVFLDEGISRFFDRDDTIPSIARMPDVELTPLDGSITEPPAEPDVQLASLEVGDDIVPADDGLTDVAPPPAALTPEEADARYAATGIWQRSPIAPAAPTITTLDDLYIASIDPKVEQFDALALPSAQALRNDDTYLSQPNPPAPGSRYDLNDQGLVIATPEGAVNPEGVRIFAGLPPVVPPARPVPPDVTPEESAQAEAEAATTQVALQAFRPKTRPDNLVESKERVQLGGFSRAELAAFRPSPRPETLKAEEEEAQPEATEFAVAQSVQPVTRPRNFSRIVARAQELQQSQPQQPTQVAAVAPRTVQPRIPSTANVARQATVTNAINLRRINLIGVYGKPSSRRALVRLSNGRYQKVKVGDRLDGGRVAAIGASELRYTKNGRNVVLDMPDG